MKLSPARFPDLPAALLLLGATAALFWPATRWITQQTVAHEQLRQSFFLLVFAAVILWIDHRKVLKPVLELSRASICLLGASFLLMAIGLLFPFPYVPLAALAIAMAAFIHVVFGGKGFRLTLPWIAGFSAFLFFVLFFQVVDWPLRRLAGIQAAHILTLFGNETQLGALFQPSGKLLLSVNRRMYEVATECNGFGLMSTSAILALLLVASRPLPLIWKGVAVLLAFVVGFAFNILRILGIVTLAPHFPAHYDLIHEAIGLVALFGGLGFLWWLLGGGPPRQAENAPPAAPVSGGKSCCSGAEAGS